jgi:hypothetical protein
MKKKKKDEKLHLGARKIKEDWTPEDNYIKDDPIGFENAMKDRDCWEAQEHIKECKKCRTQPLKEIKKLFNKDYRGWGEMERWFDLRANIEELLNK